MKPFALRALDRVTLPSPVRTLTHFENGSALWLKDDSRIHPIYGGNKCRKLVRLLVRASEQQAKHVITFGAAGSHHVLATSLLAQACGFSAQAFVVAQPWSVHAERVLCASVASGVDLHPSRSWKSAWRACAGFMDSATSIVPPGGSSICGGLGYFDAALELAAQIGRGELPEPDVIVVALGTTGTAAGLLAGIRYVGLKSKLVGVSVLNASGQAWLTRRLANGILRASGMAETAKYCPFSVDTAWVGRGYGFESEAGRDALNRAAAFGLSLDPTYTAKAFAAAWALGEGRPPNNNVGRPPAMTSAPINILYWHTLSAPCSLQSRAYGETPLLPQIQALLRPCPKC